MQNYDRNLDNIFRIACLLSLYYGLLAIISLVVSQLLGSKWEYGMLIFNLAANWFIADRYFHGEDSLTMQHRQYPVWISIPFYIISAMTVLSFFRICFLGIFIL